MSDVTTIEADVPERYADAVSTRLRTALDADVVGRIWRKDGTLWAPEGTPEVTNRLGWLDIAELTRGHVPDLDAFREELVSDGYTDVIVLGMGGSSLAPEVFRQSFGAQDRGLTLHVLDSPHPAEVDKYLDTLDLAKTLAIVSSKSGGTIEPNSMFKAFHARERGGEHYAAAGIAVGAVLDSAIGAQAECSEDEGNPGLVLGCIIGELARHGRDKLTFVADAPLSSYGIWAEQPVAESPGRQGGGIPPTADEPLLDPSAYGEDRVFLHVALDDADNAAKVAA